MKILQISNGDFFSTYGGGQVYVKNLVDEMIGQQLDIVVFSFVDGRSKDVIIKKDYKGMALYEISGRNKIEIADLIKEIKPDLIHAHAQKVFFAEISKELSIPYVITAHHGGIVDPAGTLMTYKDEIRKEPVSHESSLPDVLNNIRCGLFFYPLLKRIPLNRRLKLGRFLDKLPFIYFITPIGQASLSIERKMQEWHILEDNVDWVIAPSKAIAESMILNGMPEDKIKILPHGIPCLPNSDNIISHSMKFFYVGRIEHIKGIHVLLKAFIQQPEDSCELHLIGTGGVYMNRLKKKYSKLSNVFFHGVIHPEEVQSAIRNYDVLVHPAICLEVFGLTIAEALSEGKPVIATRCGGAEMQITDGVNGLLVPINNIEALSEAMLWAINHKEEVMSMSKKAPQEVVPIEKHVRKLVSIYQSFVS